RERKLALAFAPVVVAALLGAGWVGWFFGFALASVAAGGAGPLASALLGRLIGRALGGRSGRDRIQRMFVSLEQEAARYGHQRREDEGPAQFLTRTAETFAHATDQVQRFRTAYLRARFSGAELTPEEFERLKALLVEVRRAMRARERS
ncbi:MAG: DUF4129 domain-containing protein, partial [Myxococcota bacterium]